MAEYISRDAAIKAVCENCNRIFPEEPCEPSDCTIMQMLRSIPAADVRPVVLCKDCKHWEYDVIFADGWCRGKHQGNPNWFCADGEKREES